MNWLKLKKWMMNKRDWFKKEEYSNADVILIPMDDVAKYLKQPDIEKIFSMDRKLTN